MQDERKSLNQFHKRDNFCWYQKCNEDTRWGLNESDSIGYLRVMSQKAVDIYVNMIKWDNTWVFTNILSIYLPFDLWIFHGKLISFVENAQIRS